MTIFCWDCEIWWPKHLSEYDRKINDSKFQLYGPIKCCPYYCYVLPTIMRERERKKMSRPHSYEAFNALAETDLLVYLWPKGKMKRKISCRADLRDSEECQTAYAIERMRYLSGTRLQACVAIRLAFTTIY